MSILPWALLSAVNLFFSTQAGAAVFTASLDTSATYDAYEKDIAYVTFYFEESTAFEYTRKEETEMDLRADSRSYRNIQAWFDLCIYVHVYSYRNVSC
jgi:hypothetical protein